MANAKKLTVIPTDDDGGYLTDTETNDQPPKTPKTPKTKRKRTISTRYSPTGYKLYQDLTKSSTINNNENNIKNKYNLIKTTSPRVTTRQLVPTSPQVPTRQLVSTSPRVTTRPRIPILRKTNPYNIKSKKLMLQPYKPSTTSQYPTLSNVLSKLANVKSSMMPQSPSNVNNNMVMGKCPKCHNIHMIPRSVTAQVQPRYTNYEAMDTGYLSDNEENANNNNNYNTNLNNAKNNNRKCKRRKTMRLLGVNNRNAYANDNYNKRIYHLFTIQFGNGLNDNDKKTYVEKIIQFYKTEYKNNDKFFSDILKYLLNVLYDGAKATIEKYNLQYNTCDISQLINNLSEFRKHFDDNYKNKLIDVKEFNIYSLQIIILFTELVRLLPTTHNTTMDNYFQTRIQIKDIYNKFKNTLNNFEGLAEAVETDSAFSTLLGPHEYILEARRFHFIKDKKGQNIYFSYKNKNDHDVILICYIGIISLEDFVNMYAYNFYPLGITEKIEYADGRPLTPFEFLHHDLTHSINRYRDKNILKKEQIFINYLNDDKNLKKYKVSIDKSNNDNSTIYIENKYLSYDNLQSLISSINDNIKYNIYLVMFLIIHESGYLEELFLDNQLTINFDSFQPPFITNINNWKNLNYYGELLPDILKTEIIRLNGKRNLNLNRKIMTYLNTIVELFKKIWNNCESLKDI
jgi:hypothetical protein